MRALGFKDRARNDVFGRDEFDLFLLTAKLPADHSENIRIGFRERTYRHVTFRICGGGAHRVAPLSALQSPMAAHGQRRIEGTVYSDVPKPRNALPDSGELYAILSRRSFAY
jgi:hypothetical protein